MPLKRAYLLLAEAGHGHNGALADNTHDSAGPHIASTAPRGNRATKRPPGARPLVH